MLNTSQASGRASAYEIVFAVYPDVTQLDFTGPLEVLDRLPNARCRLASTNGGVLNTSGGLKFLDVERLDSIEACSILCVPGGWGCVAALEDEKFLGEVRRLSATTRYTTSVCTGSLLLAAAGLLTGKRAACYWAWRDLLAEFGAIPDSARIVRDGKFMTGGGVTAGIDMALALVAELEGVNFAQSVQLSIEYAPAPPFQSGTPETAPPDVLAAVTSKLEGFRPAREEVVRRAASRLRGAVSSG